MHGLLDHVHRLYPVELTEFVDDITHKVEGTGVAVLRVLPQSVEYVAKEMRALGLTVSLKSGMVASSQDFGKALRSTLVESDVCMGGSMITSKIWALMLTLEGGHVNALHSGVGTRRRTEQEGSHTYA